MAAADLEKRKQLALQLANLFLDAITNTTDENKVPYIQLKDELQEITNVEKQNETLRQLVLLMRRGSLHPASTLSFADMTKWVVLDEDYKTRLEVFYDENKIQIESDEPIGELFSLLLIALNLEISTPDLATPADQVAQTPTPDPTTSTPDPTTSTPDPTTSTPDPTTSTPEQATSTPEQATAPPTSSSATNPAIGKPSVTKPPKNWIEKPKPNPAVIFLAVACYMGALSLNSVLNDPKSLVVFLPATAAFSLLALIGLRLRGIKRTENAIRSYFQSQVGKKQFVSTGTRIGRTSRVAKAATQTTDHRITPNTTSSNTPTELPPYFITQEPQDPQISSTQSPTTEIVTTNITLTPETERTGQTRSN